MCWSGVVLFALPSVNSAVERLRAAEVSAPNGLRPAYLFELHYVRMVQDPMVDDFPLDMLGNLQGMRAAWHTSKRTYIAYLKKGGATGKLIIQVIGVCLSASYKFTATTMAQCHRTAA